MIRKTALAAILIIALIAVSACTLLNQPPIARFTVSLLSGTSPLAVDFDAGTSYDPDGTIVSYHWDFGDGASGTGKTASHTFTAINTQTYTVTLTVTDNKGATATAAQSIEVLVGASADNNPPTARFTASPSYGNSPLTVQFDASLSRDSDGVIQLYSWDFGDGSTGSGKTIPHTFTAVATTNYTVRLTVTDDKGATGSTTSVITAMVPDVVATDRPTASFTVVEINQVYAAQPGSTSLFEVLFDPSSSTAAAGGHYLTAFLWNFGDGETLSMTTDAKVKHTYEVRAPARTFVVTLTVVDEQGLIDSAVRNVTLVN